MIISVCYISMIVLIGYYSGKAFNIVYKYFNYWLILFALFILSVIGVWFLLKYLSKKISEKLN